MNTLLPQLASHAQVLVQRRFERYVSEIRTLLAKVERRGWAKETSAVRAELARVSDDASLPETFSTFHDLARIQVVLRRDVGIIRREASAGSRAQSAAAPSTAFPRAVRGALSLSASTC